MIFIKHLHTFFIMLDLKYEKDVGFFAVFVLFELKIRKIHLHDRFRCDTKNTHTFLYCPILRIQKLFVSVFSF